MGDIYGSEFKKWWGATYQNEAVVGMTWCNMCVRVRACVCVCVCVCACVSVCVYVMTDRFMKARHDRQFSNVKSRREHWHSRCTT